MQHGLFTQSMEKTVNNRQGSLRLNISMYSQRELIFKASQVTTNKTLISKTLNCKWEKITNFHRLNLVLWRMQLLCGGQLRAES